MGGWNKDGYLNTSEVMDVKTRHWTSKEGYVGVGKCMAQRHQFCFFILSGRRT